MITNFVLKLCETFLKIAYLPGLSARIVKRKVTRQDRKRLRKPKRRYSHPDELSCLTSTESIFKSARDAANLSKSRLRFECSFVQSSTSFASTKSVYPSTILSPSEHLNSSPISNANLFNYFFYLMYYFGLWIYAYPFPNRTFIVRDIIIREATILHHYLCQLNNSFSLGLMAFPNNCSNTFWGWQVFAFHLAFKYLFTIGCCPNSLQTLLIVPIHKGGPHPGIGNLKQLS